MPGSSTTLVAGAPFFFLSRIVTWFVPDCDGKCLLILADATAESEPSGESYCATVTEVNSSPHFNPASASAAQKANTTKRKRLSRAALLRANSLVIANASPDPHSPPNDDAEPPDPHNPLRHLSTLSTPNC